VLLECCHNAKGLKVEDDEKEDEDEDYPTLERYQGKFVVLSMRLM
jgi:hypothetical protein